MKNAMLVIVSGLVIIMIAVMSCKKDAIQQLAPTIGSFTPTYDTANGTVTITGTNFINVTGVSFGIAKAASFTVINSTTIVAIVGNGSGGNVTVITAGGVATHSGFTYPTIYCNCTASSQVDSAALIAYWPFDGNDIEAISKLAPMSSGGTITYVPGRIGQAIHMVNGYLTYPAGATLAGIANSILNSNDTLKNGFTISLWVQLSPIIGTDSVVTNLFQLSSSSTNPAWPIAGVAAIQFQDSTMGLAGYVTNIDSSGTHPSYYSSVLHYKFADTLKWQFVALVYDTIGHQFEYYLNNEDKGVIALRNGDTTVSAVFPKDEFLLLPTPNYAVIGSSASFLPGGFGQGFTGSLDDIRLYNKTLSYQNINDLFVFGSSGR